MSTDALAARNREIYRKSEGELALMRQAGHLLHRVLKEVIDSVDVGVTTKELDRLAYGRIKEAGATPGFLGLYGFPGTLCTSVNEQVVHGIPSDRKLQSGDILTVDCGILLEGFYADSAYTAVIGECGAETQRLLESTREALYRGIEAAEYNARVGDVSRAIQDAVEGAGFSVIENYTGHGVGRELHEEPQVPNEFLRRGPRLGQGTTLALEPMVNSGGGATKELDDQWTVVTANGTYAAHFEHTIAVTRGGVEVLTRDPEVAFF